MTVGPPPAREARSDAMKRWKIVILTQLLGDAESVRFLTGQG